MRFCSSRSFSCFSPLSASAFASWAIDSSTFPSDPRLARCGQGVLPVWLPEARYIPSCSTSAIAAWYAPSISPISLI